VENVTSLVSNVTLGGAMVMKSVLGQDLDRKLLKTPTEEFFE
jgi:hypothetical protein